MMPFPALAPEDWQAIGLTLWVALWSTALSLPFGVLVAHALARGRFRGRGALNLVVHLPLVLPPVVTGYLLLLAFGRQGPVGQVLEAVFGLVLSFRWTGAVVAAAVMGFPLMVRPIRLAIEAVDPHLEEIAAGLGARPLTVWRTITLPLILPGVLAGAVLGFARALGEFGATITFVAAIPGETRTLAAAVYDRLAVPGGEAAVLWLSALAVLMAVGALALAETLGRRLARHIAGR